MDSITIRLTDTRFAGMDLSPQEKVELYMTMIEEGALDLRDAFVSKLSVEIAAVAVEACDDLIARAQLAVLVVPQEADRVAAA